MLGNIIYIGFFFGILGTFIGGLIGVFCNFKSSKTLSCILEFAAGLMLAVVAFDLLPESFEFGGNYVTIIFFIIGVIVALLLENIINKFSKEHKSTSNRTHSTFSQNSSNFKYKKLKTKSSYNRTNYKNTDLVKTGILVGIGLALHNFPEGLAIGSRFFCISRTRAFSCSCYCFS